MTLTQRQGRLEPILDTDWVTSWADELDTGDTVTAVVEAYTDEGTIAEVQLVSLANGNEAVLRVTEPTGSEFVGSVIAGVGIVEVRGRIVEGDGQLWITRAELTKGVQYSVENLTPAPLTINPVDDQTFTEGGPADLFPTRPAHNGDVIILERETSPDVWEAAGAFDKSPADPTDEGTYRWRATRGAEEVSAEFTVTVTAQATNPTVIDVQPPDASVTDGSTVTIESRASGEADMAWAWQELIAATWTTLAGEDGTGLVATILVGPLTVAESPRQFRVVFYSNTAGDSAHSDAATVTVTSAGFGTGAAVTDVQAD